MERQILAVNYRIGDRGNLGLQRRLIPVQNTSTIEGALLVSMDYTTNALNLFNAVFYSLPPHIAFDESGLATFFRQNNAFQAALAHKMYELIGKNDIRILELGTGADMRWPLLRADGMAPAGVIYNVIATDISTDIMASDEQIKAMGMSNVTIQKQVFDLAHTTPISPLVDIVLGTYVTDSIWTQEDKRYEKLNGKWYITKYRLKVPDLADPRQQQLLLTSLKLGKAHPDLTLDTLSKVIIQEILEKVDMSQEQFGPQVLQIYNHLHSVQTNLPGGFIALVEYAFSHMITDGGVFIMGETGVNDPRGFLENTQEYAPSYSTSGIVAKFRGDDFGLGMTILNNLGYEVTIQTVAQFTLADQVKSPYIDTLRERDNLLSKRDTYVIIVSKPKRKR